MSQPSVRKGRREKAVKTERKRTKKIKEGPREKKAQGEKKKTGAEKAGEKALEQKAKEEALKNEALDFYRQLRERGLTTFDGASVDFHRKRDPVVFIPGENPVIAAVKKEELKNFLVTNNVRRVLVDALFPSRVPILLSLLEHGIEVYILRRPSALAGFKAMLERRYNKKKQDGNNGIKIPRKNDFIDAVALAFTWPKFHRKVDIPYLICWRAMNRWRRVYSVYYKVQQMVEDLESDETPVTLHEDKVIKKARDFVDTVVMHYPEVRRVFEKIRIPDDDVIAQALCCEVVLEVYHIPKKSDVLEKAGIRYSPTPKKARPKKKEKEGVEGGSEDGSKPKKKVYIHDGKLLFALTQLAIRLYHLNPRRQKRKVMWKTTKLAERIWKCSRELQVMEESGRVGEALGVSGPLEKRGFAFLNPTHTGWGLRKQGDTVKNRRLPRPQTPGRTDNTTAIY
jgi:hypothetical protein